MRIQDVIVTINQMESDGVIDRYAIGGAVGATFYLEPVATLDVHVFVVFRSQPGSLLVSPRLVDEALAQAVKHDVEGTSTRVLSAEHLAAIALQTGRAKDKARLLQFIESQAFDVSHFHDIVVRHGMAAAWARFQRQFLGDAE
jgi:hypothetical protein